MIEYAKTTKLRQLIIKKTNGPHRKRPKDEEREVKIEYFSNLQQNKKITIAEFLYAMADNNILPSSGIKVYFSLGNAIMFLTSVYLLYNSPRPRNVEEAVFIKKRTLTKKKCFGSHGPTANKESEM